MLTALIRFEIVKLIRDSRVAAAAITFAGVLLLSGIAATIDLRHNAQIKQAIATEERQRWLNQGDKDPHSAAHYSIYAFKPALPMQAVDPGISPFVGETVWLEAHLQNDLLSRPQQDANAFERMGLIDPSGLLMRFGPLVIALLAFSAAARERELGVLGLALATAPRRAPYLIAKIASVTAVGVVVLVLPVLLTGLTGILIDGAHTGDAIARLGGWAVTASAYIAVIAMMAVSLCLVARSIQVAFAGLLLLWVVSVLAALPAATGLAEWRAPLPSYQQVKLTVAKYAAEYWTPEEGDEYMARLLEKHGAARESELAGLNVNSRAALLDLMERRAHVVFDREIGGFYDAVAAQDRAYAWFGWLSPAVAFDVVSASLAGTDFRHHRDFIEAAERYRRDLVNRMNADMIAHPAINGREYTNDSRLWSEIEPLEYRPLAAATALRSAAPAGFAVVGWLLAGVAITAFSVRWISP